MKVMLLAAGEGRRLRPLTFFTPKPLLKIAGTSLLERHLSQLKTVGFTHFIVNSCWLSAQIEQAIILYRKQGYAIENSVENPLLGTAGGVCNALPYLQSAPFGLVSSDVYVQPDAYSQLAAACKKLESDDNTDCIMLITKVPNKTIQDCVLTEDYRVKPRQDKGKTQEYVESWTYSGMMAAHPRLFMSVAATFNHSTSRNLQLWNDVLAEAAENNRVKGVPLLGKWVDAGSHARLKKLREYTD